MKLTENHLKLYKMIMDRGCGRGCSDLEPEEASLLSHEQWKEFAKACDTWNKEPEFFNERTNYILPDFCVVGLITHILVEHYRATT